MMNCICQPSLITYEIVCNHLQALSTSAVAQKLSNTISHLTVPSVSKDSLWSLNWRLWRS